MKIAVISIGTWGDVSPFHQVAKSLAALGQSVFFYTDAASCKMLSPTVNPRPMLTIDPSIRQAGKDAATRLAGPFRTLQSPWIRGGAYMDPFWAEYSPVILDRLSNLVNDVDLIFCNVSVWGMLQAHIPSREAKIAVGCHYPAFSDRKLADKDIPKLIMTNHDLFRAATSLVPAWIERYKRDSSWYVVGHCEPKCEPPRSKCRSSKHLLVSLGSSPWLAHEDINAVLQELASRTDYQIYLEGQGDDSNGLQWIGNRPHRESMLDVNAAILCGGIGSLSCAIMHELPCVLLPQWCDHPTWARAAENMGIIGGFLEPGQIIVDHLQEKLDRCLQDNTITKRLRALRLKFDKEDGANVAARLLIQLGKEMRSKASSSDRAKFDLLRNFARPFSSPTSFQ